MTTFDRPSRALRWAVDMFGNIALDATERVLRFGEEGIEALHALKVPRHTVEAIVERVYTRDRGDVARELGQCQMTLEVLAKAINIDLQDEADKEFFRVQSVPKSEWERRHAAKKALGIAR